VHINKAGGTSVSAALRDCGLPMDAFADSSFKSLHHYTTRDYLEMTKRNASDLLLFATVRDPYTRQVSLFYYQLSGCAEHTRSQPDADCENSECPYADELPSAETVMADPLVMVPIFRDWLVRLDKRYPVGSAGEEHFTGMFQDDVLRNDASQVAWLEDDNSIIPPNLKLMHLNETIEDQWWQFTGASLPECKDVPLPHDKATIHAETSAHYDSVSARILEGHVGRDFEQLGFRKLDVEKEKPLADATPFWKVLARQLLSTDDRDVPFRNVGNDQDDEQQQQAGSAHDLRDASPPRASLRRAPHAK